ncbi:MAG: heavy-metal-associated domain-containing protein [Candidatus Binatia bacterium]
MIDLVPMKTKTAIISIEDLTSEAIPILSDALKGISGVESVDFSLDRKVAVVEFDPIQSNVDSLLRAVLKAGYKVS